MKQNTGIELILSFHEYQLGRIDIGIRDSRLFYRLCIILQVMLFNKLFNKTYPENFPRLQLSGCKVLLNQVSIRYCGLFYPPFSRAVGVRRQYQSCDYQSSRQSSVYCVPSSTTSRPLLRPVYCVPLLRSLYCIPSTAIPSTAPLYCDPSIAPHLLRPFYCIPSTTSNILSLLYLFRVPIIESSPIIESFPLSCLPYYRVFPIIVSSLLSHLPHYRVFPYYRVSPISVPPPSPYIIVSLLYQRVSLILSTLPYIFVCVRLACLC